MKYCCCRSTFLLLSSVWKKHHLAHLTNSGACHARDSIVQPIQWKSCVCQWNVTFFHMVWIWVHHLELGCLFRSVQFSGRLDGRFLHRESENSQIPLRSSGNVPSPSLPHAVSFHNPFSPSFHFPKKKKDTTQSPNIRQQMFQKQIFVSFERQYFSTPLSHVWQGEQHGIVLFLQGRGNVLEDDSVCCWRENTREREWVTVAWGGFEGWSQRAYFGVPDESAAGCGRTLSDCSTSSCFLCISQMVELQKFLQPLCWLWHVKFVYSSEPH